jgi:hypothetical protein
MAPRTTLFAGIPAESANRSDATDTALSTHAAVAAIAAVLESENVRGQNGLCGYDQYGNGRTAPRSPCSRRATATASAGTAPTPAVGRGITDGAVVGSATATATATTAPDVPVVTVTSADGLPEVIGEDHTVRESRAAFFARSTSGAIGAERSGLFNAPGDTTGAAQGGRVSLAAGSGVGLALAIKAAKEFLGPTAATGATPAGVSTLAAMAILIGAVTEPSGPTIQNLFGGAIFI